jgi:lipopolysaccharide biosynthesis protein
MESDSSLATISPLVNDLIPLYAFSWKANEAEGFRVAQLLGIAQTPSRFAFPAGGMFLARTKDFGTLASVPWEIDWFPEELGQLDGTLQHTAERMIGLIPSLDGKTHAFFHNKLEAFTSDESFVVADGHGILIEDFSAFQKRKVSWMMHYWSWFKSLLKKL